MEMAIEEFEAWDTDTSLLPPPTRLYHLPPIGVGTPMVESLTGYIVRLAEELCVSAGVLYWKEIRTLAAKGNIFTFRVTNDAGYSTHTINELGWTHDRGVITVRAVGSRLSLTESIQPQIPE
jgi:hypothetical protein